MKIHRSGFSTFNSQLLTQMEKVKTTSKQRTVLLVDSDKTLIHDIKDYLEHHEIRENYGLEFVFAQNAKEALKKLAEKKIDLVVLEVILPIINGYYVLSALKKEYSNIPVIIYSRLKGPQDLAKMASYKVDNIFLKQLMKMEDLIQMIVSHSGHKAELDKVLMELQSQVKSLSSAESQASQKVIQCPRCHAILPQGSHFCNNCGQKIFRATKQTGLKKATESPSQEQASLSPSDTSASEEEANKETKKEKTNV